MLFTFLSLFCFLFVDCTVCRNITMNVQHIDIDMSRCIVFVYTCVPLMTVFLRHSSQSTFGATSCMYVTYHVVLVLYLQCMIIRVWAIFIRVRAIFDRNILTTPKKTAPLTWPNNMLAKKRTSGTSSNGQEWIPFLSVNKFNFIICEYLLVDTIRKEPMLFFCVHVCISTQLKFNETR